MVGRSSLVRPGDSNYQLATRRGPSSKELLLTGQTPGSGALALQLALRVGIVVRQQNSRVVRQPGTDIRRG